MERDIVSSDNPNLINGMAEADRLGIEPEPPGSGDGPEVDETNSVSE